MYHSRLARRRPPRCASCVQPLGRVAGHRLVPEARLVDAVGEAVQVDAAGRPGTAASPGAMRRVVADEVALGERRPSALAPGTGPCRGWSAAARSPSSSHVPPCAVRRAPPARRRWARHGEPAPLRSRLRAAPPAAFRVRSAAPGTARSTACSASAAGRSLCHSASGAAATSSLVRPDFTDSGCSSGSHPASAYSSCLCSRSHCSLPLARSARVATDEDEAAVQLLAVELEVQLAGGDRRGRVLRADRRPRAPVPDDDVTAAVLAPRDHPLEVGVLDGMVLDVDRQPARRRVERWTLGHRPAHQDAVELQPEVVVEAAGAMALHHESQLLCRRRVRAARRLLRAVEVADRPVPLEPLADTVARCLDLGFGFRHTQ